MISPSLQEKPVPLRILAALMASLERRASRVSGKFKAKAADSKRLLLSVSSRIKRTSTFYNEVRKGRSEDDEDESCCVWQKAILMGDRCQPPDFSGVIYYDENGKQVDQFPFRSPRNSPLSSYVTTTTITTTTKVRKETLLEPSDLIYFQNHSSQMAALDYLVSLESDIFVPTYDGNMAKLVEGHRRYLGYKKSILLDRKMLVQLIDQYNNGSINWDEFSSAVKESHSNRIGNPAKRLVIPDQPKEEDYFYANPEE